MTSDQQNTGIAGPDMTKKIINSKLYQLARGTTLLGFLIPEITTQISVEVEIDEAFPREEEWEANTRIFINYTNLKGRSIIYDFLDKESLDRQFDLDHFMNGFLMELRTEDDEDGSTEQINKAVLAALNMAVTTILNINNGSDVTDKTRRLSEIVLQSLVSIIFNDPLDVMIAVNERPPQEGETESTSVVVAMWVIKSRNTELPHE